MTEQDVVSIFEVETDGSTGVQVATGTLIDPLLVLVHEPYASGLRDGSAQRMRVGIVTTPVAGATTVDVVDGTTVHRVEVTKGRQPLVTLDLARPSTAAHQPLPDAEEPLVAALFGIAGTPEQGDILPRRPADLAGPGFPHLPGDHGHLICQLFPWVCEPPDPGETDNRRRAGTEP